MLIQPDGNIRLIRNCPLNNSYEHTIYFKNKDEQANYFKTRFVTYPFAKQSYQRYDKGVLHIQAQADTIYDCNYLMFQNSAFGDKWFYAFINSIEYVNNVSSKVYYEIDVLQTWMGGTIDEFSQGNKDYIVYPCFIERQHAEIDEIGNNLIPEDLAINDYVYKSESVGVSTERMTIVIQYTGALPNALFEAMEEHGILDTDVTIVKQKAFCGVYHDSSFLFLPLYERPMDVINDLINAINIIAFGGLINVFMMPSEICDIYAADADKDYSWGTGFFNINMPSTLDGYIPMNKKLYTYPYMAVCLSNNLDSEKDYAFERFAYNDDTSKAPFQRYAYFKYVCPLESSAKVMAYPNGYNGITDNTKAGIHSAPMAQCGFAGDKLATWFANNSLSVIASAITKSGSSGAMQKVSYHQKGESASLMPLDNYNYDIPSANNVNGNYYKIAINSDVVLSKLANICALAQHTSLSSNSQSPAIYGSGANLISAYTKTIKREIAEVIDSYFTKFGYAIKSVQQPKFDVRERYTFIKTVGFSGRGNVPSGVMKKICAIHDKGVTYWRNEIPTIEICDYSKSNLTNIDLEKIEGVG